MADADDDISDPELQPHATPGGATAGPQGPFPNPFSPVVGSPTAGGVDMSQMVAMMQQMMMTSEAAAQAAAAAVQAVRGGTSGNAGASSVSGFSDANKVLSRPANFGSTDHGFDLSQWQDWAHSFRTWLIFADGRYEEELAHVEAHLSTRVVIIRFSTHWHWLCRGRDCLVVADSHTGSRNAWALPRKGGTESMRYATAELCRYLNVLGHNEVTLKSDNEPTCLALKAAVKAYRTKLGLKTHREAPEPGDHQSNPAEQAIEFLRQLTCTILAEYEKEAKTAIGSLDPIHGWAWRHAGWMAHRFVKSHGITSFELVTGRPYNGKIISFGETCFGRIRSKVKGHPRWVRMLWLGKLTVVGAETSTTVTSVGGSASQAATSSAVPSSSTAVPGSVRRVEVDLCQLDASDGHVRMVRDGRNDEFVQLVSALHARASRAMEVCAISGSAPLLGAHAVANSPLGFSARTPQAKLSVFQGKPEIPPQAKLSVFQQKPEIPPSQAKLSDFQGNREIRPPPVQAPAQHSMCPSSCVCYDMTYSDDDAHWLSWDDDTQEPVPPGDVRALQWQGDHVLHQQVEIVLDSGAYANVGRKVASSNHWYRDAQGNPLKSHGIREAVLALSGASVKDRWLIAPVTSPLLSLGKLYRVGWSVGRDQDDNLVLERDGIKIPVYLKQNSLCVRGDIRVVMSDPTCDVRALQLHGPFLALTERFQVLSEGVHANRCNSSCLIDCATALAAHDVRFRTTLINGPQGWKLHELNAEVARLDDPESALPHQGIERLHEIITIATSARVNMLDLFPEGDHKLLCGVLRTTSVSKVKGMSTPLLIGGHANRRLLTWHSCAVVGFCMMPFQKLMPAKVVLHAFETYAVNRNILSIRICSSLLVTLLIFVMSNACTLIFNRITIFVEAFERKHYVGVTPGGFLVVRRIPERFSDELCTVLREMPYSQAAFLAGHVGQARAQRTPAGDDGPAVNAEVVPPEAPPPEQRLLPDDAMLSELVPQLPRPSIAAGTPEPPTPHQAGIASADAVNEDVAMPEPSPAGVGASPSGSSSSGSSGSNQAGRSPPETPADHVAPGSSEPAPVRKKLRLMAVTKIGDQEFYHVDGESPDEDIEADLGDGDLEIADDGQEQTLDMPQSLILPLDHGEPELSDEELARIDQIAMEYELQRLGRMKVLAQVDGPIPGHRTLTTKFVVTWRLKSFGWIRRARLVAREYHFLGPGAGGEFEPNPGATGGGLMHVDDLLATAHGDTLEHVVAKLSERYTIAVQWIKDIGDELTFLKRVHRLISDTELEIQTACNVSDVGTKYLNPGRTEYLLGLMGIKDADNGYAPLGQAHAAMIENARAVRAVCRDLKHFAKRGEASAQMLSIMLLALQMTPSSGQPDQDDDSDENTGLFHQCLMFCFTVLECFGEFLSQYPSVASAGLQVMLLIVCMFVGNYANYVEADVRLSKGPRTGTAGRFHKVLKAPEESAPGTPARPLPLGSDDSDVPEEHRKAAARGARSKAKSSPRNRDEQARGSDEHAASESSEVIEEVPQARWRPKAAARPARVPDVWVSTRQGYAFHRIACTKLKHSDGVTEISRREAVEKGYTPPLSVQNVSTIKRTRSAFSLRAGRRVFKTSWLTP
ncbi:unnamed protein product [Symbiodinium natans]|uniref:Copia protein n=1 Tax=Symbiodinium natans TaxID=878477 RepID=A0A812RQY2_9DINO|nr:unnamed protein product [Symbiodinium natans]